MAALIAAPDAGNFDLLQLLLGASGMVRGVLFLLVCLSIIGWYVIGYKWFYLSRAQNESIKFLEQFWQAKRLDEVYQDAERRRRSPIAYMFKAGYVELSKLQKAKDQQQQDGAYRSGSIHETGGDLENIERALHRAATSENTHLESMVPFLATVGSAAPFIGLFGTVVGIIDAFHHIANQGSANLATVAPGIAEALGTTAIGLIAAVPAVMAYNFFARKIKVLSAEMDSFANDFLNIVKRHFLR
ncbi:MAG TPA: protein TolQ [Polyangia bacterium]|nr:protein TolQ [Polyangia bacterium]